MAVSQLLTSMHGPGTGSGRPNGWSMSAVGSDRLTWAPVTAAWSPVVGSEQRRGTGILQGHCGRGPRTKR